MPTLPPMDGTVNHAPHVVILGAGASIAAYSHWGKIGNPLPSMQELIDTLSLREPIEKAGYSVAGLNFEAFYDDLVSKKDNDSLRLLIEQKVYDYFSSLKLPNRPTIYDYLILSLRKKDIIATFNWDPFLLQAYIRNKTITEFWGATISFLHGNVLVGICESDCIKGVYGSTCSKCQKPLSPSRLLYPVAHKDYNKYRFIKSEWDTLRQHINHAYLLTIFGYSAPVTDIEAKELILDVWKNNELLEQAEVEIVDVLKEFELEKKWNEFFIREHYSTTDSVFNSYLFSHPRRSCDAFSAAHLMCKPWDDNPFPDFKTLNELQNWIKPLIEEEIEYEKQGAKFTGNPISTNTKKEL